MRLSVHRCDLLQPMYRRQVQRLSWSLVQFPADKTFELVTLTPMYITHDHIFLRSRWLATDLTNAGVRRRLLSYRADAARARVFRLHYRSRSRSDLGGDKFYPCCELCE